METGGQADDAATRTERAGPYPTIQYGVTPPTGWGGGGGGDGGGGGHG